MKTVIGYKFIKQDMTSKNGEAKWKLGEWKKWDGKSEMCSSGFHASPTPLDSLEYIYGDRWFVVEARGKILKDDDKFCCSEMRLVKEIPVMKVVKWFAISCARQSLKFWDKEYPNDKRPLEAIEAAENYLRHPTKANLEKLSAAESAAESAARSAAGSAWSARSAWSAWSAWSAAGSVVGSAWSARSAMSAWSAAGSAWSARSAAESAAMSAWSARSAAEKEQNTILMKLIKEAIK